MPGRCAFWYFHSGKCFPRLCWSIWTWPPVCLPILLEILRQGPSSWRWWNRGRWIRRLPRECGGWVWWWASAMLPRNALRRQYRQRRASHAQVQFWLWFWCGGEPRWRVYRRASMEVHSVRNQRRRTGGERRRFQKVSGIRDSPVSRRSILSKSFKGHVASHAFVVLGGHPISSPGAGSDPFRSRGQTPWSGQKRLDRAACPVLVTSGVTDAQWKSCPWWISPPGNSACRLVRNRRAITSITSGGMLSLLGLQPFKRASMAWPNSLTVGSALSSSMTGRGMIELRAALVTTVSRR